MKALVLALGLMFGVASSLQAQALAPSITNHWATLEECMSPAADSAPYYLPEKLQSLPYNPQTEIVLGLSQESCVDLDVPDRLTTNGSGGYAWVKTPAGVPHIYGRVNGQVLRRGDCNNKARQVVSRARPVVAGVPGLQGLQGGIGPQGQQGPQGPSGQNGTAGLSNYQYQPYPVAQNIEAPHRSFPWGKAGIAVGVIGAGIGVGLVCALSNDGCFNHTQIVTIH